MRKKPLSSHAIGGNTIVDRGSFAILTFRLMQGPYNSRLINYATTDRFFRVAKWWERRAEGLIDRHTQRH